MQVVASGPLPTASFMWRGRTGGLARTVVSKATFALEPSWSLFAAEQVPLRERDECAGHDPVRWLHAPADLVPYKMRADVVLVGHAFAPHGTTVRSLRARLAAFGVDKTLEVIRDRRRGHDGRELPGPAFSAMPLSWDRAPGSAQNPAGISPLLQPDLYGTVPLPNLSVLDVAPERAGLPSFGPIAPWWPARREKLGRRNVGAWLASWKDGAVPEDADDALFQVAPPEQQLPHIDTDGLLYMENLHPTHARLTTRLAHVTVRATVERPGRPPEALALIADTVWIDTDSAICTVTWRGCTALAHPEEVGTIRVWTNVAAPAETKEIAPALPADPAVAPSPRNVGAVVPAVLGGAQNVGAPLPNAPRKRAPTFDPRQTEAVNPASLLSVLRPLPFEASAAPVAAEPPAPPVAGALAATPFVPPPALEAPQKLFDPRETRSIDPAAPPSEKLPFAPAPPGAPSPLFEQVRPPAPRRSAYDPRETKAIDPEEARAALAALPFGGPPSSAEPAAQEAPLPVPLPLVDSHADDPSPPPASPAPFDVQPPAWLGPIAAPPMVQTAAEEGDDEPPPTEPRGAASLTNEANAPPAPNEPSPPAWLGEGPPPTVNPSAEADSSEPSPAVEAAARRAEIERRQRDRESFEGMDLSGLALSGIVLEGASLIGVSLENADLSGAKLRAANLTRARLSGTNFSGADLSSATLIKAEGVETNFASAILSGAKASDTTLRKANFANADITSARFDAAILEGSAFTGTKAGGANFDRANLVGTNFSEADLQGATFAEAQCSNANFGKSQLGKSAFRAASCDEASFDEANLAGARMNEAVARAASFRGAKLEAAQLRGAAFTNCSFVEAILTRVVADKADLSSSDLTRANLSKGSFREANLRGAIVHEANLSGADLRGADMGRVNATKAQLTHTRLDGIKKDGAEGL